jgi:hypothetical protein
LLFLSCLIINGRALEASSFSSAEDFKIPSQNGTITFNTTGTFEEAQLESSCWRFTNLKFTDFPQQEKLNLTVSAQNSHVTIMSYLFIPSNASLSSLRIRYTVEGQGTQTFNFGAIPKGGIWNVVVNGVYLGREDKWTLSEKSTVIVNGVATGSNVSIVYYTYPDFYVALSSRSFYERNSVAVNTAIALAASVALAAAVAAKTNSKKPRNETPNPPKNKIKRQENQ